MFVDIVSSEYDLDCQDAEDVTSKWNHHEVKQQDEGLECRKILASLPRKSSFSLAKREIEPMMAGCSSSYTQNADGSWKVEFDVRFTNESDQNGRKEVDNDAGKGTSATDNDAPDSRDRDQDRG